MRTYLMEAAGLITTFSMKGDHHCYASQKVFSQLSSKNY